MSEEDLKEHFLSAYNEAAAYEPHEVQDLGASIRDLLSQERELIALRANKYLNKEAYEEQHEELLQQLKEYETEYATESRRLGDGKAHKAAYCYSDRLVRSLEVAEINGYKITFKFKNGAAISRIFNNETNRKETWARKAGGMNRLAFWCNGDKEQMLRIFATSGLYRAGKSPDYYEGTAVKAIKDTVNRYQSQPISTPKPTSNSSSGKR